MAAMKKKLKKRKSINQKYAILMFIFNKIIIFRQTLLLSTSHSFKPYYATMVLKWEPEPYPDYYYHYYMAKKTDF